MSKHCDLIYVSEQEKTFHRAPGAQTATANSCLHLLLTTLAYCANPTPNKEKTAEGMKEKGEKSAINSNSALQIPFLQTYDI